MKKTTNIKWSNLIFIVILALFIIPQSRKFIQVGFNQLLVKYNPIAPGAIAEDEQIQLDPFDYRVRTLDGIDVNNAVGKGRVTFISYWATWCPPCIAELPSIEKLYADYGNKMTFLIITNEDPVKVQRFVNKKELNIPAVIARMEVPNALYERSIPTNYIIDKTGKIVLKKQGAANWNSENIRNLLDSLILPIKD